MRNIKLLPVNFLFNFRSSPDGDYLPVLYIDQLVFRTKDLVVSV